MHPLQNCYFCVRDDVTAVVAGQSYNPISTEASEDHFLAKCRDLIAANIDIFGELLMR